MHIVLNSVVLVASFLTAAGGQVEKERLGSWLPYSTSELVVKANVARRTSADGSIVVVSASKDYLSVLVNWLAAMEALALRNILVICLDRPTKVFLEKRGLQTAALLRLGKHGSVHRRIWRIRVTMLAELLSAGFAVTLSDLDAIWRRDAHPFLRSADVVASRGSFPTWAAKLWGASACMGLARFNAGAQSFVASILHAEVMAKGDDQVALNAALWKMGVVFPSGNLSYVGSQTTDLGQTRDGLTVALLPHAQFVRRCDAEGHESRAVVVRHCYAPKTATSKRQSLSDLGEWGLRPDWDAVPVPSLVARRTGQDQQPAFSAWLRNVTTSPSGRV